MERIKLVEHKLKSEKFSGESIRKHLKAALDDYKQRFSTGADEMDRASMLSLVARDMAREMARDLGDTAVEGDIARRFLVLFKDDISEELGLPRQSEPGQDRARYASIRVHRASILAGQDPLHEWLHGETTLERAARDIRTMAEQMSSEPDRTLEVLQHRLESDLATLDPARVELNRNRGVRAGKFSLGESPGQVSEAFLSRIFLYDHGCIRRNGQGAPVYTQEALKKIRALREALKATGSAASPRSAHADARAALGVTETQEEHLASVERSEAGLDLNQVRADLATWWEIQFGTNDGVAKISNMEQLLDRTPITITAFVESFFGKDLTRQTQDDAKLRPATRTKPVLASDQALFGRGSTTEGVHYVGAYSDPRFVGERGADYLRFRHFKDKKMVHFRGFEAFELPGFGALNTDLDNPMRAGESTKRADQVEGKEKAFGENYYGNMHMVLRRDRVSNRVLFTCSDHGQPRRNPLLAVWDALDLSRANWTGMGSDQPGENVDQGRRRLLRSVVNAMGKKEAFKAPTLPFEAQIFGPVNPALDVEAIYVSERASADQMEHLKRFGKENRVRIEVMKPPKSLVASSASDLPLKGLSP